MWIAIAIHYNSARVSFFFLPVMIAECFVSLPFFTLHKAFRFIDVLHFYRAFCFIDVLHSLQSLLFHWRSSLFTESFVSLAFFTFTGLFVFPFYRVFCFSMVFHFTKSFVSWRSSLFFSSFLLSLGFYHAVLHFLFLSITKLKKYLKIKIKINKNK